MNRHSKFYAELSEYADDDDYYEEEEEEYYDDDDETQEYYNRTNSRVNDEGQSCYSDTCVTSRSGKAAAPPAQLSATQSSIVDKHTAHSSSGDKSSEHASRSVHVCISATDPDYDLLDAVLPELHTSWKTQAPSHLPLTEMEAVQALRECNYDVEECVHTLQAKRAAQRSTRTRTLHIGQAAAATTTSPQASVAHDKSRDATGNAVNDGSHDEPREDEEGTSAGHDGHEHDLSTAESEQVVRGDHTSAAAPHETTFASTEDRSHAARSTGKATSAAKSASRRATAQSQLDDSKPDCTFVIAGHVDAGKSTTLGHLLLLLGRVSLADVERNQREARRLNKESFKYAWLLDQSEEERRRGVTIDSGSFSFETEHRRVHILDAPGHKDYVLSMISSATQADAALLVVTAGTSEFENGLAHGTRDHLEVLKTLGVGSIVVVVNKMDSVDFSQERFDHVVAELKLLFKQFRLKDRVVVGYCPVSGMLGTNLVEVDRSRTPWYDGPSLLQLMDRCSLESRLLDAPLRLSLQDVQGNVLYAKVECGRVGRGDSVVFVPCHVKVVVKRVEKPTVAGAVPMAFAGETIELSTSSSLIGLVPGCVGCEWNGKHMIATSTDFEAQVQTFANLPRAILPGMTFTMIVHALTVTVKVVLLVSKMDKRTGEWSRGMVKAIPASTQALIIFRAEHEIALEPAENCRALGRFVLHQNGDTVAGGLVKRVLNQQPSQTS